MKHIDLRSDTVTQPTQEMREAIYNAIVGDDVYREDPTMKRLEEYAAALLGKEAALFVPSGTFGNQLALLTHCQRGDEIILGDRCHIVQHEVGASSVIAGVQLRTLQDSRGMMDTAAVDKSIRNQDDVHYPSTGLICIENAHSNGMVGSLEYMQEIYSIASKHGLPVHLDGARIFNAALYLGVDAAELAVNCDSVMFCLSKGLCAPVGSILAGNSNFIEKARKGRKLMGGGLRQAGILAGAGLVALEKMRYRLAEDHDNAQVLGKELASIEGIKIDLADIHINMVFFDMSSFDVEEDKFIGRMLEKGIKVNGAEDGMMRLVTNQGVTREDIYYVVESIKSIIA